MAGLVGRVALAPPRLLRPQNAPRLCSSTGLERAVSAMFTNKKTGALGSGFYRWAIPISARTQNLTKGDGLGILFEVEVQHHPVLKDIDRVDEVVDDLPLVSRTVHISLPEPLKPEQDLFPARGGCRCSPPSSGCSRRTPPPCGRAAQPRAGRQRWSALP